MHPESHIRRTAAVQGGVITRRQALGAGLTDKQIRSRIATERWTKVTAGGYKAIIMPGRRNLVRAATTVLPDCVASHYSAAALHVLRHVDTRVVSVTVPSRTTHVFPNVRVYRSHDINPNHVVTVGRIPTTSVPRTIVDLAAVVHSMQLRMIIDDAIAAQRTSALEIRGILREVARRGKPGVTILRAELARWIDTDHSVSPLERSANCLLKEAGLTGWQTEFPIPWAPRNRFDVAFEAHRLAIEWDSRRWHTQGEALERDRQRDAEALAHGWRTLRFTWADVHRRPDYVIATIRSVLELA